MSCDPTVDSDSKMNDEAYLFPKILHGTADQVRSEWSNLVNIAIFDHDAFLAAFNSLQLVEVRSCPGKIIVHDTRRSTEKRACHWRLNVVSAAFLGWWKCIDPLEITRLMSPFDLSNELASDFAPIQPKHTFQSIDAAANLQQDVVLFGMKQLWFSIALMHPERNGVGFVFPGKEARKLFFVPYLRQIVNWLPEINALLPRLYYGLGTKYLLPYVDAENPQGWWSIWAFMLHLVEVFRPSVSFVEMKEIRIPITYEGRVVKALIGEQIIRESGDRYILNE